MPASYELAIAKKLTMNDKTSNAEVVELHDCGMCGKRSAEMRMERETFLYGSGAEQVTLEVLVPVYFCTACEEQSTSGDSEILRHEAVCRHLKRLTSAEIRGIRENYGMSQDAFAQFTGFGSASIKRWETGAVIQNDSTDRYLRLLSFPENFARLDNMLYATAPVSEHRFRNPVSEATRRQAAQFNLRASASPDELRAA